MNENYQHPAMPDGAPRKASSRACTCSGKAEGPAGAPRVQLLGSGTILREVIAAADLLEADFGVAADIWSCPSFTELRREAMAVERWNLLHPTEPPRKSHVERASGARRRSRSSPRPTTCGSSPSRSAPSVPRRYRVLGTDGFGRSDFRKRLRDFFEVDRHWVALAALKALADEGTIEPSIVGDAITRYGIDTEKPPPWTV